MIRLTPPEILALSACQVPDLEPVQIKSASSPERDLLTARDGKACTWLAGKANNPQEALQDSTDWGRLLRSDVRANEHARSSASSVLALASRRWALCHPSRHALRFKNGIG